MTTGAVTEEPPSPIMRRYYDLRQYLGLDTMNLDKAYMETPMVLQQAGELSAEANHNENVAKHTFDILRAEAAERIRSIPIGGKDPSEARITSLLPLQQDVQDARGALDNAVYEAALCQALYKTLDTQARLLPKASEMVTSGYIAPTVAYDERRAELHRARVANRQARQSEHVDNPTT